MNIFLYPVKGANLALSNPNQLCPGAVDDSRRGFRRKFHALAEVQGVDLSALTTRAYARANAQVLARAHDAHAQVTDVSASAAARAALTPEARHALTTSARAIGTALWAATGVQASSQISSALAASDATMRIASASARTGTRRSSVEIGPDLVEMELEEILFLMEIE